MKGVILLIIIFFVMIAEAFVEPPFLKSRSPSLVSSSLNVENDERNSAETIVDDTLSFHFYSGKPVKSSHRQFLERNKSQYVDKTLFIRDILLNTHGHSSFLLSRPRGFGKSLALSSVYYFCHHRFKNTTELFSGLKIMGKTRDLDKLRERYMSKFPVVWIDFGTVTHEDLWKNMDEIKRVINNIFLGHYYLLKTERERHCPGSFQDPDPILFSDFLQSNMKPIFLERSMEYLVWWIHGDAKQRPIILIDNFDVPFQTGYKYNFFWDIAKFMWKFCSSFMHEHMEAEKIILTATTGIPERPENADAFYKPFLKIEPLTIFQDFIFSERFGFTDQEVKRLLQRSENLVSFQTLKNRYGGYMGGNESLFNPVFVINYLFSGKSYQWIQMESNKLLEKVLVDHGLYPLLSVQQLLAGEPLEKELLEFIHYPSLNSSEASYWSYLVHSGYLVATEIAKRDLRTGSKWLLRIPNLEARRIIESTIKAHSKEIPDYNSFIDNMRSGNSEEAKDFIEAYIKRAGKYFPSTGPNITVDNKHNSEPSIKFSSYLRSYVVQMLQGLKVRYNMVIKETEKPDGIKIGIESQKGEVLPISVVIQRENSLGLRWERIKRRFCSVLNPVGKLGVAKAEILITYESSEVVGICLNYGR